uniref:Uncharacterized protein n=1 Tax=Arundo donax TaxID=35708 RepID=A0A0A9GVL6_ARUDO
MHPIHQMSFHLSGKTYHKPKAIIQRDCQTSYILQPETYYPYQCYSLH